MNPTLVIEEKRRGETLAPRRLSAFLEAYVRGEVPDYQMAAFLMAAATMGLDESEIEAWIRSTSETGSTLSLAHLDGPRVDRASTGGVGDKASLVIAPLAAALGLYVPMIAGRGLGLTGGTIDKLESIAGVSTDLSPARFEAIVAEVGCAIMAQTIEIAPLDRRVYALRDVTGTASAPGLMLASLLGRKLTENLDTLLVDVTVGSGSLLGGEPDVTRFAESVVRIGEAHGLRTIALETSMHCPLGRAIGSGLEVAEAIRCLRGGGPADLVELVVTETAELLAAGSPDHGPEVTTARVRTALSSGEALERFARMVKAQGGDATVVQAPGRLETAMARVDVTARTGGVVIEVAPQPLARALVLMGGGRTMMHQPIHPGVGFELYVKPGDRVSAGELLGVVHARDVDGLRLGVSAVERAVAVGGEGEPPVRHPLIGRRFAAGGQSAHVA